MEVDAGPAHRQTPTSAPASPPAAPQPEASPADLHKATLLAKSMVEAAAKAQVPPEIMDQLMAVFESRRDAELAAQPLVQRKADATTRSVRAAAAVAKARASHAQASMAFEKVDRGAETANAALVTVEQEIAAAAAMQPTLPAHPSDIAAAALRTTLADVLSSMRAFHSTPNPDPAAIHEFSRIMMAADAAVANTAAAPDPAQAAAWATQVAAWTSVQTSVQTAAAQAAAAAALRYQQLLSQVNSAGVNPSNGSYLNTPQKPMGKYMPNGN